MAAQENLIVEADNRIGAATGDWVLIEGSTGKVAEAIALVYVLPLVLFFLFYFLSELLIGYGTGAGILGFLLGLVTAVLVSRRQQKNSTQIHYKVVAYAEN
jgi:sigma-E factor negative regulatory protein RseC